MAKDPDAMNMTLNYEGGSLTMPLGNLKDIFGDDFDDLNPPGKTVNVSVSQQTRVRVIGGATTTILPFTYSFKQWPTSQANNAAAGNPQ